jgi:hypothetical protein
VAVMCDIIHITMTGKLGCHFSNFKLIKAGCDMNKSAHHNHFDILKIEISLI